MRRWFLTVLLAGLLAVTAGCGSSGEGRPGADDRAKAAAGGEIAQPTPGSPGLAQDPAIAVERIPWEWVPGLEEVATLHLSLGLPVPLEKAPQPLYASHPHHRLTVALLLDMLADARLAPGEISLPSRAPTLQVAMRDGTSVSARLAYDCTPFTSETGHGYTCRQAPGEVILHTRQGREVRTANRRLALWLSEGWQADVPVGPAADMEKETALDIARKVDAKARWTATFYKEYPVEGKGGTQVRRAWLMEAEHPTGSKTRLVVDAQSGEVLRLGQLEALE